MDGGNEDDGGHMLLSYRFLAGKSTCEMMFSIEFISCVHENSDRYNFDGELPTYRIYALFDRAR